MPDSFPSSLAENIRQIAVAAMLALAPADAIFGTVVTASPLSVYIDQKRTLPAEFLIVPAHLRDIPVEVEINLPTDEATHTHEITPKPDDAGTVPEDVQEYEAAEDTHGHTVTGKISFTLPFGLKNGDRVALLRKQGGGDYIILGVIP